MCLYIISLYFYGATLQQQMLVSLSVCNTFWNKKKSKNKDNPKNEDNLKIKTTLKF